MAFPTYHTHTYTCGTVHTHTLLSSHTHMPTLFITVDMHFQSTPHTLTPHTIPPYHVHYLVLIHTLHHNHTSCSVLTTHTVHLSHTQPSTHFHCMHPCTFYTHTTPYNFLVHTHTQTLFSLHTTYDTAVHSTHTFWSTHTTPHTVPFIHTTHTIFSPRNPLHTHCSFQIHIVQVWCIGVFQVCRCVPGVSCVGVRVLLMLVITL